jgi:predicted RNase H-like nuclease (RuvC/YqgF family)
MTTMFDMYRAKKKKVVDPNAPPRPNLLNHEKRLKDATVTLEQVQQENHELRRRLDAVESKLSHQSNYLSYLQQFITRIIKK